MNKKTLTINDLLATLSEPPKRERDDLSGLDGDVLFRSDRADVTKFQSILWEKDKSAKITISEIIEIIRTLENGQKLLSVKMLKEATGLSLKESKETIFEFNDTITLTF